MKWACVNQMALIALCQGAATAKAFGLSAIDQAFVDADVKRLLDTLIEFDYATRRFSADFCVTISAVFAHAN